MMLNKCYLEGNQREGGRTEQLPAPHVHRPRQGDDAGVGAGDDAG